MDNKKLFILLQEHDDDEILLLLLRKKRRKVASNLYQQRLKEGYSNILVRNHLLEDDHTFKQFFRLNKSQFHFVLGLVGDRLKKMPSRRIKLPIKAEEKLSLTLRYIKQFFRYIDLKKILKFWT